MKDEEEGIRDQTAPFGPRISVVFRNIKDTISLQEARKKAAKTEKNRAERKRAKTTL